MRNKKDKTFRSMIGSINAFNSYRVFKDYKIKTAGDFILRWIDRPKTKIEWTECYKKNKDEVDRYILRLIDRDNKRKKKPIKESVNGIVNEASYYATKEHYPEYLITEHWKNKRASKLKQVGNRCEICGSINDLQVHHLTYKLKNGKCNLFCERLRHLMVLCRNCHQEKHGIARPLSIPQYNELTPLLFLNEKRELCFKNGELINDYDVIEILGLIYDTFRKEKISDIG